MASIPISQEESQYIEYATINADDDLDGVDDGGALNPEQGRDFFLRVRQQTVMRNNARIIPMVGNGIEISRMNLNGRILERDTFQSSTRRAVDTDEIALNGKRIKAAFRVTRGFLEQNIMKDRVMDSLVNLFARKFANGCEQMLWLSNTLGHAMLQSDFNNDRDNVGSTTQYVVDNLYNLFNGMIKTAISSGNVVNAAGSTNLRLLISQALKALPSYYRNDQDISLLRLFMPVDIVINLRNIIGERRTQLGDISVTQNNQLQIAGIPVVGVPLLSNNPTYTDHVTLGTTGAAKALTMAPVDQDDLVVIASTLSTSAVSKYTLTTDYTVNESNGTVTWAGTGGSIGSGATVKCTYPAPPLFVLTFADNILWGLNEDFRIGEFYDVDTDTTLVVIRSRIDFKFQEDEAVVVVKNVQDAIPTSTQV